MILPHLFLLTSQAFLDLTSLTERKPGKLRQVLEKAQVTVGAVYILYIYMYNYVHIYVYNLYHMCIYLYLYIYI